MSLLCVVPLVAFHAAGVGYEAQLVHARQLVYL
jgi:hypothetical protein